MGSFLDLIFPKVCYSCGRAGHYFCPQCVSSLIVNPVRFKSCHPYNGSLSLFPYNSAVKNILVDLKYNFVTDTVNDITAMMHSHLKVNFPNLMEYWLSEKFVLTSVSLSHYRNNWRGFNQSDLICSQFAQLTGLKYHPDILMRTQNNLPQVSLPHKIDRIKNAQNIFAVCDVSVIPSKIIIFDDVCTTMSTLKSAAKPLVESGRVSELWALSLAGFF